VSPADPRVDVDDLPTVIVVVARKCAEAIERGEVER
jgi:hypothetical protein